ncbi:MAG: hypothetical protein WAU29_00145 [Chitinophagaceae bacterium]|nr:hypothetical protein [Chitinophagaceae bacterium]
MSDEQNKDSPQSTSDNKQQEHQLNPPAIDESIVQATANTEAEKPTTYNPQLTTQEDMEVHHHSHNSHGKKNWKSYFWEFLMLFLAVFCGFLAEYQLEHKIEKERARKYMYDMVENLKYDTIRYNRNLVNNETIGMQLDSFRAAISVAIKGQINGNRLYELWLKCSSFNSVVFNRTAITQLKNSGSFRLIKNNVLSSSISDYYERKITACEEQEEKLRKANERLSISSAGFFYYEPFDQLLTKETTFKELTPDSIIKRNSQIFSSDPPLTLLNTNPADLKLLYNDIAMKENAMKEYNAFLRWARETAIALMQEIDKEYHFKK